ncbi:MAG: CDP-glucose 4,6-dehydratase [Myxococcales bacterium]|nr:CDP-glucose 4,6-dehydratase [Myxococcales bacterium]
MRPQDCAALFAGRRVLVTGHTGFKGAWLSLWLASWGARVTGYSLEPPSTPSCFELADVEATLEHHVIGDIRDGERLAAVVEMADPEVIFHLAAQPLVLTGYDDPIGTLDVNVMGTARLLDVVRRRQRPCAVVIVTSDKCYAGNAVSGAFEESSPFGGQDPYSASKGAAELVIQAYRQAYFPPDRLDEHGVLLASGRAGNVIGGGDWAAHRIVPDAIAGWVAGQPVELRHPAAVRPWQHVLEPLWGYLLLAGRMLATPSPLWCRGFNFGPGEGGEVPVFDLVERLAEAWGEGVPAPSWRLEGGAPGPAESATLRLAVQRARAVLGWSPTFDLDTTVARTAAWYRRQLEGQKAARQLCLDDIDTFQASHREAEGLIRASLRRRMEVRHG